MLRRAFPLVVPALAAAMMLVPVAMPVGLFDAAAHADSRSRAAAKARTVDEDADTTTSARSATRRATRGASDADGTVVARQRTRRQRGPASDAETVQPFDLAAVGSGARDIWDVVGTDQAGLDARIATGSFDGAAGALALYQLTGKAAHGMSLSDAEAKAHDALEDGAPADLFASAGARLLAASTTPVAGMDAEILARVALQLGLAEADAPEGGSGDPISVSERTLPQS